METHTIESIREAERKSHTSIYTSAVLFEKGTWLSKPVRTVTDLLPFFSGKIRFRGLDLGCGIGRNCIPIARYLSDADCKIDCVDILDIAILSYVNKDKRGDKKRWNYMLCYKF